VTITALQMKVEIQRQLVSMKKVHPECARAFFEIWGPMIETLIMCGATASEIIRDVWGVEDALDCIGWFPVGDDSNKSEGSLDDPEDEEDYW